MQSGLGKLILKEEKEKQLFHERYARSLSAQRQTNGSAGVCSASALSAHLQNNPTFGKLKGFSIR